MMCSHATTLPVLQAREALVLLARHVQSTSFPTHHKLSSVLVVTPCSQSDTKQQQAINCATCCCGTGTRLLRQVRTHAPPAPPLCKTLSACGSSSASMLLITTPRSKIISLTFAAEATRVSRASRATTSSSALACRVPTAPTSQTSAPRSAICAQAVRTQLRPRAQAAATAYARRGLNKCFCSCYFIAVI